MSLKGFHIFFISVATLGSLGFAGWAAREYHRVDGSANLVYAVGGLLFAGLLLGYGRWFLRKLKEVA